MSVAAIFMVLLGCADDGDQCQRVGTVPVSYASVAACNAAISTQLPQQSSLDWPVIAARCEASVPVVQVASAGG